MSEITEQDARQRLLAAHSPAHKAGAYQAERVENGWLFSWAGRLTDIPMGATPWVVSDSGQVAPVVIGQTARAVLAAMRGDD